MNSNTRLIVNTLAQHIRTIVNIVLSLYSTRIVMQALGISDYGIYMLVASIVSLLSYISNTLIVTTQRFLSFSTGAGNSEEAKRIFSNSYIIHWVLGIAVAVAFFSLTGWLFDSIFNIPLGKTEESIVVYYLVIATVVITFISSPFRALLISHENIVYISTVDVLDGILKLALVFSLFLVDSWRLPLYALILASVMLFNLAMLAGYSLLHYEESCIVPNPKEWDKAVCRKLIGFAIWTVYGMACTYLRAQGIAVIINRVLGTLGNAAFGIALQVHGSIQFLSAAVLNAVAPQIIKSEGEGDRQHAIHLTLTASKFNFLLLAMAAIPLIAEVPNLLQLWLHEVPAHAVFFCRMLLLISLCDQTTIALGTLNQAVGQIRNYTLVTFTVKILCIPAGILCIHFGIDVSSVMFCYLFFELLAAIIRIPFLIHTAGLQLVDYLNKVMLKVMLPVIAMCAGTWLVCSLLPSTYWRFLVTGLVSCSCGVAVIWLSSMNHSEKKLILHLANKILTRHNEKVKKQD